MPRLERRVEMRTRSPQRALPLWAALLLAMLLACGGDAAPSPPAPPTGAPATSTPSPAPTRAAQTDVESAESRAPEFSGIAEWINSPPLTMEALRGNVVLVDFWTYTCINCIRTFPHLKEWHEKYADKGLVIVGVHSPEFLFETRQSNVERAVSEFDIPYAVALDNTLSTWQAFRNRSWPGKFLIDREGVVRLQVFGEGRYAETERRIRELLAEKGESLDDVAANTTADAPVYPGLQSSSSLDEVVTRELYASSIKNLMASEIGGQRQVYIRNSDYSPSTKGAVTYDDPGVHENHYLYLHGEWANGREGVTHARRTSAHEDYVAARFYSNEVNVVAGAEGSPYRALVTIDGRPLTPDQAGVDIEFDADGRSYFLADRSRMYNVVLLDQFEFHDLIISSNSDEFTLYTFSFGHYQRTPWALKGVTGWLNSEPLTLADLRGRVVLAMFFSVGCDSCARAIPFVESWLAKYGEHGLSVIGVHTPVYDFERDLDATRRWLDEQRFAEPVALDADGASAGAFGAATLPAMFLLDKEGYIRRHRLGVGGYTLMEQDIRHWLADAGADLSYVAMRTQPELEPDARTYALDDETRRTRDLFLGASRNGAEAPDPYFQQPSYFGSPGVDAAHDDPGNWRNHYVYLHGAWRADAEAVAHARDADAYEDYVGLRMVGIRAAAILSNDGASPQRVRLTLDDQPLPPEVAGEDVLYDEDGNSYVLVERPGVYRLVELAEYGSRDLKLWTNSRGLAVYEIVFEANAFEPEPF